MNKPVSPVIYLLRRDLVVRQACAEGLALFDELAALQGRKRSLRLTWAHLLWLATDARSRECVAWAQRESLLPRLGLAFADLRGADLEYAYMRCADLSGADLYAANLRDANFRGADLRDANFRRADLRDANLAECVRHPHDAPIEGWVVRGGLLVEAA